MSLSFLDADNSKPKLSSSETTMYSQTPSSGHTKQKMMDLSLSLDMPRKSSLASGYKVQNQNEKIIGTKLFEIDSPVMELDSPSLVEKNEVGGYSAEEVKERFAFVDLENNSIHSHYFDGLKKTREVADGSAVLSPKAPSQFYTPVMSYSAPLVNPIGVFDNFIKIVSNTCGSCSSSHLKKKIPYYIPVLSWLPRYSYQDFVGDFISGLTVGVMVIAQGLAYAGLAKQSPIAGLYTAFFPLLVYLLLGTSKQVSIGPEVIIATLFGNSMNSIMEASPDKLVYFNDYSRIVSLFVGLVVLIFGLLRIGYVEAILSQSVMSALISAVALGVVLEQLIPILGISSKFANNDSPLQSIKFIIQELRNGNLNKYTVLVSGVAIAVLVISDFLKQRYSSLPGIASIPTVLIVVVISTYLSYQFSFTEYNISVMGNIEGGFTVPYLPNFNNVILTDIIPAVLTIAVLNFILTFLIIKQYAIKRGYNVSPNRELVALGLANVVGSFFGCFTASGGLCRSKVNDQCNSRTPGNNFFAALVVLIAIYVLLPTVSLLPKCAVAAIVIVAVAPAIDLLEMNKLWKLELYQDLLLYVVVFCSTFIFGTNVSILLAFVASLAILLKNVTVVQPQLLVLGRISHAVLNKIKKNAPESILDSELLESDNSPKPDAIEEKQFITPTGVESDGEENSSLKMTSEEAKEPVPRFDRTVSLPIFPGPGRNVLRNGLRKLSIRTRSHRRFDFVDMSKYPQAEPIDGVLILQLKGALHFANIGRIQVLFRRVQQFNSTEHHFNADPTFKDAKSVILELSHVDSFDGSSLSAFVDILSQLKENGSKVLIAGIVDDCFRLLIRSSTFRNLSKGNLFPNIYDALDFLEKPAQVASSTYFQK